MKTYRTTYAEMGTPESIWETACMLMEAKADELAQFPIVRSNRGHATPMQVALSAVACMNVKGQA